MGGIPVISNIVIRLGLALNVNGDVRNLYYLERWIVSVIERSRNGANGKIIGH